MKGKPIKQDPRFRSAVGLDRSGDFQAAADAYRALLKDYPNHPELNLLLGNALANTMRFDQARRYITKALRARPTDPDCHCAMAYTYRVEGRFNEAHAAYDRALANAPGYPRALAGKAVMHHMAREDDRACALIDADRDEQITDPELAVAFSRIAPRVGRTAQAVGVLERFFGDDALPATMRIEMHFRLGKLLDGLGEYDRAWEAYDRANKAFPARFDADAFSRQINRTISAWGSPASMLRSTVESDLPVLIVGMPRSGTSLVEQILASHGAVHGAGEVGDLVDLARAAGHLDFTDTSFFERTDEQARCEADRHVRAYLASMRRYSSSADRITDKSPLNFARLGLVDRLLPGARVIHCTRDPLDTCLSCYFQQFPHLPWSFDLAHLGRFYRDYHRLMAHWRRALDVPILDVAYEELVADPDSQIPRLLGFVGLEVEPACFRFWETRRTVNTASNEQVTRPMYATSAGRHQHYIQHLGPLIDALGKLAEHNNDPTEGA